MRPEKEIVRDFYNNFGWKLTEAGIYNDTAVWVDRRKRSSEFSNLCARRVGAYLPRSGTYLLDAGSGAIPHPVYMEYHANFARRICVDFSIEALHEAQQKLGDRGIYVLGDITNLPFRDDAIDAVISNHVLYHVPADKQAKAFRELWRVTRPGSRAVVVYAWKAAWLPKWIARFAVRLVRLKKTTDPLARDQAVIPNLYYYAHSMKWFRHQNWPFKFRIVTFRVVSEEFMSLYLDDRIKVEIAGRANEISSVFGPPMVWPIWTAPGYDPLQINRSRCRFSLLDVWTDRPDSGLAARNEIEC